MFIKIKTYMKNLLLKPLYLVLKKDMIKKLSEKHGEQFVDDVMETFDMPTNLLEKAMNNSEKKSYLCKNKSSFNTN